MTDQKMHLCKITNMTKLRNFAYLGNSIAFNFGGNTKMINATQMCKSFGKRPIDFLRLPSTINYIELLKTKISEVRLSHFDKNSITYTSRGGNLELQGTWIHYKLALRLAQWLNPEFAFWVDERIEELLTTGKVELNQKSDEEKVLEVVNLLTEKIKSQKQLLLEQKPKVEFYEEVLDSKTTYTVRQIAKDLGMSAMKLNRFLHLQGVQFNQSGQWLLYAKYQNKGYTDTKTVKYGKKGNQKTTLQTRWTNKGRQFIHNLFNNTSNIQNN